MFFKQNQILVKSTNIYTENYTSENKLMALQVTSHVLHTLTLRVKGDYATMEVDNLSSSHASFCFPQTCQGYFSLVSNNRFPNRGGYRYMRLSSNEEVLLEIDFTKLSSVHELKQYFDCYYFETLLPDATAQQVDISQFWSLNEMGYLICSQHIYNMYHHLDASNMCLLTFRDRSIGDFKLELEFAQTFERYGVVFGCDKEQFPYQYDAEAHRCIPLKGAFAYVEAEGHRTMRGNLIQSMSNNIPATIIRYSKKTLSTFYASSADGELLSSHNCMLIYCIDASGCYECADMKLPLCPGHLIYLPPYTRYKPAYTHDKHIVIEFETYEENCLEPDFVVPRHPDKIYALFEKMLLVKADKTRNNNYKSLSLFYQILAETHNNVSIDINIPELIRPSIRYMEKHFSNPELTIAEVAQASNISEVYFRQIFKKSVGQLPNKYIFNLRINQALFLLQSSRYSLTEIAIKSGFSDIKYFMTAFKKATGSSPHKYRNLNS